MVLAFACLSTTAAQSAADAAPTVHRDFTVTRVAGGFRVTLDLDKPLPTTADNPTLSADGRTLGPATESADGTKLSLVTIDPSVLDATSVTTESSSPVAPTPAPDVSPGPQQPAPQVSPTTLTTDPATPGPYHVAEGIYDFGDQAIALLDIGGIRGELEGKVYLPQGGPRNKPVVIFEHGRHSACYGPGTPNPAQWPCTPSPDSTDQRWPIPSFLGYDAPARALASHGYVVVSVSANAINANDNQLAPDYGANARGELILDTLRMLQKADKGRPAVYHDAFTDRDVSLGQALSGDIGPADLVGQLDLHDVGVMGHSRGGEGVVAAATLNDALPVPQQFGIKAVLPLAPVDYNRMTLPDAATATILPYCDGDVENLMGQHIVDDSRHAFDDNVLRSSVLVMGANHNYFNTIWTPGGWPSGTADDWAAADGADDPVCDPSAADTTRLTPTQQVAVETAYVAGFFRLTLGGEKQFQPLFDGSDATTASTAFAHISVTATQPAKSREDIATFEHADPDVRATGDATAEVCASMGGQGGVTLPQAQPFCSTTLNEAAVPHWSPAVWAPNVPSSPMLHMTWTGTDGQVRVSVPRGDRDVSRYQQLSVKVAADEHVTTGTDLTVSVVDSRGRTWSQRVSQLDPAAVTRMPGTTSPWLRKVILQQVTIPTSALHGLDLRDIKEIRFRAATGADGGTSGGVYLSDLSAENPSVGASVPEQQATVSIAPARVDEGSGPGTAQVAAVLSAPVGQRVTAYVNVFGAAADETRQITFAPGRTCVAVTVPTYGDTVPGATPSTAFKVNATDVNGAVMGAQGVSTLTVQEDDGVTGGGTPAPEVGTEGNVCSEYAATLAHHTLQVSGDVTRGRTATLSADGYRSGESVSFALGSTTLGRATADRQGRVSFTVRIPDTAATGKQTLTATGAGSQRVSQAQTMVHAAR